MKSEVYNMDCLEYMRTLPDKAFQLAIADPPYGIGEDGKKNHSRGNAAPPTLYTPKDWDKSAPEKDFFKELCRVTKHQIIWGANHFIENLPRQNASCWIVWDKENGENDFADCELAWTSLPCSVRRFRFRWAGMLQGDMANKEIRIHPTQKPVALYAWILTKFAKQGDTIFDPMMGSQSSRIAANRLGFDYVGCEIDKEYFDKGCERFEKQCHGIIKMNNGDTITQTQLEF
jgi:site-specific DNA-methyltransferase (adenine-specific)